MSEEGMARAENARGSVGETAAANIIEVVARAICNAHRTWPGRSDEKQRDIVNQAWRSHEAEARAALDAIPQALPWRSMESAPKDGTQILAFLDEDEGIEIIEWEELGWKGAGWEHSTGRWSVYPLRWQPLPPSPNPEGETK